MTREEIRERQINNICDNLKIAVWGAIESIEEENFIDFAVFTINIDNFIDSLKHEIRLAGDKVLEEQ